MKTKLVVFNNHTLGYVLPENPDYIHVLKSSILRGTTFCVPASDESKYISSLDSVRLASEQDFEDFRVSFTGYKGNDTYEYKE